MHPSWYRLTMEEENDVRSLLPRSQGHAFELWRTEIAGLHAEIAFITGKPAGDVVELMAMSADLSAGSPIVCESCHADIYKTGHAEACELAYMVREVRTRTTELSQRYDFERQKRKQQKDYAKQVERASAHTKDSC